MGSVTEDELVAAIRRIAGSDLPRVVVGIGDDGAVVDPGGGSTVISTDMLVEGVHFEMRGISVRDLGYKALTVNVSDLAAMASSPRHALVSLGLPRDTQVAWAIELFGGMLEACAEHAMSLVGGDLSAAPQVVISVTVTGEVAPGRAVLRSGARPGDRLAVTGTLGAAAGGLALARSSSAPAAVSDWGRELLRAHSRPTARVGEAQTLAGAGAHAMIDISDGLSKDLWRICEASGVGARLDLAAVPVSPALRVAEAELSLDAMGLALFGGEDYELLVAIAEDDLHHAAGELKERFGVPVTDIGGFTAAGTGLTAEGLDGRPAPMEPRGWDHFEPRS